MSEEEDDAKAKTSSLMPVMGATEVLEQGNDTFNTEVSKYVSEDCNGFYRGKKDERVKRMS